MAAASLCLAAVACSKDDIALESAPQQGITPTKFIFNVTRSGYEGETETRAPKDTKARRKPVPPRTNGKRETWFILGFRELSKIQPPIPAVNGKLR